MLKLWLKQLLVTTVRSRNWVVDDNGGRGVIVDCGIFLDQLIRCWSVFLHVEQPHTCL